MIGADEAFVREVIFTDRIQRKIGMMSTNLSLSEYLQVRENIRYVPAGFARGVGNDVKAAENALKTVFYQKAVFKATGIGFDYAARKLEEYCATKFGENASRGKLGFEEILRVCAGH